MAIFRAGKTLYKHRKNYTRRIIMTDYIYRAVVKNNGKQISYYNGKGQIITYKPSQNGWHGENNLSKPTDAALLFNTVNKYFTSKDPNITPEEQVEMRADIAQQRPPISGMKGGGSAQSHDALDIYEGVDFLLKTFSDEASEGGKNITPNEVYRMFEIFHQWTK